MTIEEVGALAAVFVIVNTLGILLYILTFYKE